MSGSVEGDLVEVKQRLQQNRQSIPAVGDLRQFLKLSREAKLKNPEDVSRYGSLLLKHHKHKLADDELWQVHEQASIISLEMGDTKAAIPLIKAVLLQFPENSIRARRLQVLYYEAAGAPDQAKQLYEGMLKEQPYNTVLPKRMEAAGSSAGALELPGTCARSLLTMYQQQAPGHLTSAAQQALQKQLQK